MTNNQQLPQITSLLIKFDDSLNSMLNQIQIEDQTLEMMEIFNDHSYLDSLDESDQQFTIFQQYKAVDIDQNTQNKINNLNLNYYSNIRKSELFKSYKIGQFYTCPLYYKKFSMKIKEELLNTNQQISFMNESSGRVQNFRFSIQDLERLQPNNDLNDTIIGYYLKFIKKFYFTPQQNQKVFIYSTYFIGKLLKQLTRQDNIAGKDQKTLIIEAKKKVIQNYETASKWTKNEKLFDKQILVFPINIFNHWNCIFVLNPNKLNSSQTSSKKCQIIYCDSLFQKQQFVVQAIRKYIELYYNDKHKNSIQINENILPSYQLLLPRQINSHDCGLFMLSYIQELLSNPKQLQNLSIIHNRRKLSLFPKSHILILRELILKLIIFMIRDKPNSKAQICHFYDNERSRLYQFYGKREFDKINESNLAKYIKLMGLDQSNAQTCFKNQIQFYLDKEINYYQSKY